MPDQTWALPLPLSSDRVRLREHRTGDLDDLMAFHGDEEVTRYTPWPVRDRAQTIEALTKRIGQRRASITGEAIVLAIEEIDSSTVIGETLLFRQADDEAMLGYALRRDRWGQGLATEAANTMVDAGFDLLGLHRVSAVVIPANAASVVVLHKLGFTSVSEANDRATFELTAERWREQYTGKSSNR